jgi:hypothetical protein
MRSESVIGQPSRREDIESYPLAFKEKRHQELPASFRDEE